jgi:hypothetical protein
MQLYKTPDSILPHWNYFLALENDLEAVSRYIEFCPDNFNTYSIELAHLLMSAASEVDTLAKCICRILDPKANPKNINDYRAIIKAAEDSETYGFGGRGKRHIVKEEDRHRLSGLKIYLARYGLELSPWESWAKNANPDWWHSYNNVKHQRNRYFNQASLKNALHAVGALLAINYVYCRLEIAKTKPDVRFQYQGRSVMRYLNPSRFLRFAREFYDNPFSELGEYVRSEVRSLQVRLEDVEDTDK